MRALEPWHLAILAVVLVALFGAKRLPDSARSLGRSMRIFRTEISAMNSDATTEGTGTPPAAEAVREVTDGMGVPPSPKG